jgi:hypothetical protein
LFDISCTRTHGSTVTAESAGEGWGATGASPCTVPPTAFESIRL